jgi:hypothetical protein
VEPGPSHFRPVWQSLLANAFTWPIYGLTVMLQSFRVRVSAIVRCMSAIMQIKHTSYHHSLVELAVLIIYKPQMLQTSVSEVNMEWWTVSSTWIYTTVYVSFDELGPD